MNEHRSFRLTSSRKSAARQTVPCKGVGPLALRIVLAVVFGVIAFVWGALAVSHKCLAGSQLIESSFPFVVAALSAGSLFVFRRYAVATLLLVVLFALVLLGGSYYKAVIHRGAPEETESVPPPNNPALQRPEAARFEEVAR
jgi:hypothetical protein